MIDEQMKAPLPPPPTRRRRGTTRSRSGPGAPAESAPAESAPAAPEAPKEASETKPEPSAEAPSAEDESTPAPEEQTREVAPEEPKEEQAPEEAPAETKPEEPAEEQPKEAKSEEPKEEQAGEVEQPQEAKPEEPEQEPAGEEQSREVKSEEPADEAPQEAKHDETKPEQANEEQSRDLPNEESQQEPAKEEQSAEVKAEEPANVEQPQEARSEEPAAEEPQEAKTEEPADEQPQEAKTEEPAAEEPQEAKHDETKQEQANEEQPEDAKPEEPKEEQAREVESEEPKPAQTNEDQSEVVKSEEPQAEEPKVEQSQDEQPKEPQPEESQAEEPKAEQEVEAKNSEVSPASVASEEKQDAAADDQLQEPTESAREVQPDVDAGSAPKSDQPQESSEVKSEQPEDASEGNEPSGDQPKHEDSTREVEPESTNGSAEINSAEDKPASVSEGPHDSSDPAEQEQKSEEPAHDAGADTAHAPVSRAVVPQSQDTSSSSEPDQPEKDAEEGAQAEPTTGIVEGGAAEEYLEMAKSDETSAPTSEETGHGDGHHGGEGEEPTSQRDIEPEQASSEDRAIPETSHESGDASRDMATDEAPKETAKTDEADPASSAEAEAPAVAHPKDEDTGSALDKEPEKSETQHAGGDDASTPAEHHDSTESIARDPAHDESDPAKESPSDPVEESSVQPEGEATEKAEPAPTSQDQDAAEPSDEAKNDPEVAKQDVDDGAHEVSHHEEPQTSAPEPVQETRSVDDTTHADSGEAASPVDVPEADSTKAQAEEPREVQEVSASEKQDDTGLGDGHAPDDSSSSLAQDHPEQSSVEAPSTEEPSAETEPSTKESSVEAPSTEEPSAEAEPSTKEASVEAPSTKEPSAETEPSTKEASVEAPSTEHAPLEKDSSEGPASEEAPTAQSSSEEPSAVERSVVEEAPVEKSVTEEAPTEQSSSAETIAEKPSVEESSVEQPSSEQPSSEQSSGEPSVEKPTTREAPVEQPSADAPSVESAAVEEAPAEQSSEEPSAQKAATEETPAEHTPTEEASSGSHSTDEASAEPSSVEQPTSEEPSVKESSSEEPSLEKSAEEEAHTQQHSTEDPSTGNASTEAALVEPDSVEKPVTGEALDEQSSSAEKPTEKPATAEAPLEQPSTRDLSAEVPPSDEVAIEQPSVEKPAVEDAPSSVDHSSEDHAQVPEPSSSQTLDVPAEKQEHPEEILEGSGNGASPLRGTDDGGHDSGDNQAGETFDLSGTEPIPGTMTHGADDTVQADKAPQGTEEQLDASNHHEPLEDTNGVGRDATGPKDSASSPDEVQRGVEQSGADSENASGDRDPQPHDNGHMSDEHDIVQAKSQDHPDTSAPSSQEHEREIPEDKSSEDPISSLSTGADDSLPKDAQEKIDSDRAAHEDSSATVDNADASTAPSSHDVPKDDHDESHGDSTEGNQDLPAQGVSHVTSSSEPANEEPAAPAHGDVSKPTIVTTSNDVNDDADEGLFAVPPTPRSEVDQTKPAHLRDASPEAQDVLQNGRAPSPLAAEASREVAKEDDAPSKIQEAETEHEAKVDSPSEALQEEHALPERSVDVDRSADATAEETRPEAKQPNGSHVEDGQAKPRSLEDHMDQHPAADLGHQQNKLEDEDVHDNAGLDKSEVGQPDLAVAHSGHDTKPAEAEDSPHDDVQQHDSEAPHVEYSHPSTNDYDSDHDSSGEPFALESRPKALETGPSYDGEGYGASPMDDGQHHSRTLASPQDSDSFVTPMEVPRSEAQLSLEPPSSADYSHDDSRGFSQDDSYDESQPDTVSDALPTPTQNVGFHGASKTNEQDYADAPEHFQRALNSVPDESAHTVQGTDDLFDDDDDYDEDSEDESVYGEAVVSAPERIVYQAHGDESNVALGGNRSSTSLHRNSLVSPSALSHRSTGSRGSISSQRESTPVRYTDGYYVGGPNVVRADWAGEAEEELRPSSARRTPNLYPATTEDTPDVSPFALRQTPMAGTDAGSMDPRGISSSRWNPERPQTPTYATRQPASPMPRTPVSNNPFRTESHVPQTPDQSAEPDVDPSMFMPRDVTNVPWHARADSVPMSLHSQTTLSSGPSSPIHSSLAVDRNEPVIRDSWPTPAPGYQQYLSSWTSGRPRGDSSLSSNGGGAEYDPFKPQDAGANANGGGNGNATATTPANKGSLYNPFAQRARAESAVSATPSSSNSSPGRGSMLFQKMRSVFENPAAGGSPEQPPAPKRVSGVFHGIGSNRSSLDRARADEPQQPGSYDDDADDRRRAAALPNEEDFDERSTFLRSSAMPSSGAAGGGGGGGRGPY